MKTVAISITGEPHDVAQFLSLLNETYPFIELCKVTQSTRCTDMLIVFTADIAEDALELFEFQHGTHVQTGFTVRENA